MATSKTLTPTNVTISIPAMTDAPNASVLANCADKEADAINALNSQIGNQLHGLTAASNITLNGAYKGIAGTIRVYNLRITAGSSISADTALVTGFDAPALAANGGAVGLGFNNASRATKAFFLNASGELRCAEALTNGEDYRIGIVYRS